MSRSASSGWEKVGWSAAYLAPITAAIYDNFTGTAATLVNGRSTTQGGATWSVIHGSVVTSTGHAVNGNGEIYTNAAQANFTVIQAGYSDNFWVSRRTSPFWNTTQTVPEIGNVIHLTYSGDGTTNLWIKTCAGFGGLAGANTTMRTFTTGSTPVAANTTAANADANIANVQVEAGDTHSVRHRKVAAQLFLDTYQNQHLFQLGLVDFAANGSPLNGNVGFGASSNYPSTSRIFTDIWIGDPTAVGFITVDGICRVRQINADGSCDFQLHGEYTQYAPLGLTWSLFDVSGGSSEVAVTNVTSVSIADLATTAPVNSVGTWTGTVHVASGDLPTKFTHRAERTLPDGTVIYGYSGVERPGYVPSFSGQSLQTHEATDGTSGETATGWIVQGSLDYAASDAGRRTARSGTANYTSKFMDTFFTVAGLTDRLAQAYMSGGTGGTYFLHPTIPANGRSLGTAGYTALTEGLMRAGNRICGHFETLGQFEGSNSGTFISSPTGFAANTTYQAALEAALIAAWNDMEDRLRLTRGTMPIILLPVNQFNTISSSANTDYEAVRRFQRYMVLKYQGARAIYDGPITYDQVHANTDPFHLSNYDEQARRKAYSLLKILSKTALDRLGPTMKAITRVSAIRVDVQYNTTGGDTMEIVNGGAVAASGFDGGHRFFVGTGLGGSQVHATSAVLKGGTTDTISFGFAANTFPGVVSVGGPNGSNPFNPTNDGGVSGSGINALANWNTQACMVREHWASEPSLPLRPYYDAAGLTTGGGFNPATTNDYMSAS